MSILAKLLRIAGILILYLAISDVIGVVVSFVFDISPSRSISGALFYAVWFVLGVFCGLLSYNTAGGLASPKSEVDWSKREDATKTGRLVCATSALLLTGLSILFYVASWRGGVEADSYVPDSMSLTLTFFVAVAAATFLGHSLLDAPKGKT